MTTMEAVAKKVFVTGASGFVGSAVIEELLSRGHTVRGLVNRGELKVKSDRLHEVRGDLFNPAALDKGLAGCDALIHLVGIIKENPKTGSTFERVHFLGAKNVMEAAQRSGVRRFIHMSALGSRSDAVSEYHKTKFKAESALRESGLDWTIFRPSLIHGPEGEFLKMEAAWARRKRPPFLFMPYFGGGLLGLKGDFKVQPVYVKDVARAFADALQEPRTVGRVYPLGGKQPLTWPQMHHLVAKILTGKKRAALPIPAWYATVLTRLVPPALLPFSRDQIIMALEDSTCDIGAFVDDFEWEPRAFDETLRSYADSVLA